MRSAVLISYWVYNSLLLTICSCRIAEFRLKWMGTPDSVLHPKRRRKSYAAEAINVFKLTRTWPLAAFCEPQWHLGFTESSQWHFPCHESMLAYARASHKCQDVSAPGSFLSIITVGTQWNWAPGADGGNFLFNASFPGCLLFLVSLPCCTTDVSWLSFQRSYLFSNSCLRICWDTLSNSALGNSFH